MLTTQTKAVTYGTKMRDRASTTDKSKGTDTHPQRQTDQQHGMKANSKTRRDVGRKTDRQADRQAGRQTDKETGRQAVRQIDRQTLSQNSKENKSGIASRRLRE